MKTSDSFEGFISSMLKENLFCSDLPQPPGFVFGELLQIKKCEMRIFRNQDSPSLSYCLRILSRLLNEDKMRRTDAHKILSTILSFDHISVYAIHFTPIHHSKY